MRMRFKVMIKVKVARKLKRLTVLQVIVQNASKVTGKSICHIFIVSTEIQVKVTGKVEVRDSTTLASRTGESEGF